MKIQEVKYSRFWIVCAFGLTCLVYSAIAGTGSVLAQSCDCSDDRIQAEVFCFQQGSALAGFLCPTAPAYYAFTCTNGYQSGPVFCDAWGWCVAGLSRFAYLLHHAWLVLRLLAVILVGSMAH